MACSNSRSGHHLGAGVRNEELDLAIGIERVQLHHDPPGAKDSIVQDDRIGRVGQAQAEAVVLLKPQGLKPRGNPFHLLTEFGVGVFPAKEIDGHAIGKLADRAVERFGQQTRTQVPLRIQDPAGIKRVRRNRRVVHRTSFPNVAQLFTKLRLDFAVLDVYVRPQTLS